MDDFFYFANNSASLLGFLLRAIGFFAIGYGLTRFFILGAYSRSNWQLQMAIALGFFGLLIALTTFSSPGSAGAFALGAGIAFFLEKQKAEEAKPEGKAPGRKK